MLIDFHLGAILIIHIIKGESMDGVHLGLLIIFFPFLGVNSFGVEIFVNLSPLMIFAHIYLQKLGSR